MLKLSSMPTTLTTEQPGPDAIRVRCPAKPWFGETWPKFRFAERDINSRWLPVAAIPDVDLALHDFCLGSQIRDAGQLADHDQIELAQLLGRFGEKLSPIDEARLSSLLECCPFTDNLPPIDLDPQADDVTEDELLEVAGLFTSAWEIQDLGGITWASTGGRGLHGEIRPPEKLASPLLMRVYGTIVRRVAATAGLPLLSQHRERKDRPRILVDDTLFDRDASGRGGLWRLLGAPHTKTGRRKRAIEFDSKASEPTRPDSVFKLVREMEERAAERGGLRRKPRNVHDLNGLPKPHPQLLGKGALKRVAEMVTECARRGANHEFRKSLAGWLLRSGVPTTVASETISAAGDPVDAFNVVKTTADRMMSGRKTYAFRKLCELVGTMGATDFQRALTVDLDEAEVAPRDLSRFLSPNERLVLSEAADLAEKAGHKTRALTCRRASKCGIAKEDSACKCCGDIERTRFLVAERPTCPHCANRRSRAIINWAMRRWTDQVWIITKQLPDQSLAFAKEQKRYWAKRLRQHHRTNVRWIIAPGWLAVLTHDSSTGAALNGEWVRLHGWNDHRRGTRGLGHFALMKVLRPILAARAAYLRRFVRLGDAQGLADDAWCEKVMESTAGKKAREAMPWPKPRDLRLDAINDRRIHNNEEPLTAEDHIPTVDSQRSERTKCCNSRFDYMLMDAASKELIATRDDRPWTFAEGSVRAAAGWRNERMEFNDRGALIRWDKPKGFDVNRLIE